MLGGADETVKMSTSPTLLLDTRSAVHSTAAAAAPEATTTTTTSEQPKTVGAEVFAAESVADDWKNSPEDDDDKLNNNYGSNDHSDVNRNSDDHGNANDSDSDDDDDDDDENDNRETVVVVAGHEDVTAERSAPVVVAAGLGHAEWQLLAAAGAGVAMFLSLALYLAYRRTGCGSPALHKVVQHDDAECPPLLDYAPRPLDFAKYLGECTAFSSIFYTARLR